MSGENLCTEVKDEAADGIMEHEITAIERMAA